MTGVIITPTRSSVLVLNRARIVLICDPPLFIQEPKRRETSPQRLSGRRKKIGNKTEMMYIPC